MQTSTATTTANPAPAPTATAPAAPDLAAPNAAPSAAPAGTLPAPAETTIKLADHQAALERVRQEEKAKLYPDLDSARKQVEALTSENTTLKSRVTTLETSVEALNTARDGSGKIDVKKLVEEVTIRAAKTVADGAQTQIATLQTQVNELQNERNTLRLEKTREKLIAEAGGPDAVIPELVRGNTEAELRSSIAESKKILDAAMARRGITTQPPVPGTPVNGQPLASPNVLPSVNGTALLPASVPPMTPAPVDTGSGTLRPLTEPGSGTRMSPTEWKAVREARLAAAQGRYPTR